MKRLSYVAVIAMVAGVVVATTPSISQAAALKCKVTKAVGHPAKVVKKPALVTTGKNGKMTLVTNCGNIVITTFGKKAPNTVNALTVLAKAGYFNASLCHRLTTSGLYVLQCGDPGASGMGGPGWQYADENLPGSVANNYPAGTVAMANSGPNTNGSQFFLVFGDTTLNPSYTIWGQITSGLDIVKAIAAKGVVGGGGDGTPAQKIAIEKIIVG